MQQDRIFFTDGLLSWSQTVDRGLPWKATRDPYAIWLSEILLQQTRVAQGLGYYLRFMEAFPTVQDLAAAPADQVLKLWEGLGYYSRARNLHATARQVATEYGGRFPTSYEELLLLRGVGPYTAAAIASFAFDEPRAVLDGNVFRVLSRYFGIDTPIDQPRGKQVFAALAQDLVPPDSAALYNQAIMDFGALQCTPRKPSCDTCPLRSRCAALATGQITALPAKERKSARKTRYFHYLVVSRGKACFIRQRTAQDIWQQLYEFPMLESAGPILDPAALYQLWPELNTEPDRHLVAHHTGTQMLTHQQIKAAFYKIEIKTDHPVPAGWIATTADSLSAFAYPKIIREYIEAQRKSLVLRIF